MSSAPRAGRWGPPLRCGPFDAERYGTTLRWLTAGGRECVRMIAMVVRDRQWRTLSPDAASVRGRARADGSWTVVARTPVGKAMLDWRFEVAPRPRGIEARVTMQAAGDVVTNRAGLVALLPTATFAGARFTAIHGDGTSTRGRLPESIAPHQPMVDLAAVRIAAARGPILALAFDGDTFEMEDHRNWLDPSFKLYSRSLSRPYPYRIRDGACVAQRTVIDLDHVRGARSSPPAAPVARRGRLPALGVATAPARVPSAPPVVTALRELAPQFVLHRADAAGRSVARAGELARSLGATLRLEGFGDDARLVDALVAAAPETVALHRASEATLAAFRARARGAMHTGGTFADFVMINREPIPATAQRTMFAVCPTVHAADDRSLIESLDALPRVFAQARRIARARPVDAGPCALRRRLWPKTARPADRPRSALGVPYDVDPRQRQPIAAAWLATVIAAAAAARIASLCAFEAAGDRGLLLADDGPAAHGKRSGTHVRRTPAFAVLAALGARRHALLTLYAMRAASGAAFVVGDEFRELWLVELSGRRRRLPRAVAGLGPLTRLGTRADGATWIDTRAHALDAYGIVRVALHGLPQRVLATIALDWCAPGPMRNARASSRKNA